MRQPGLLTRVMPVRAETPFMYFILTVIFFCAFSPATSNEEMYPSSLRMAAMPSRIFDQLAAQDSLPALLALRMMVKKSPILS